MTRLAVFYRHFVWLALVSLGAPLPAPAQDWIWSANPGEQDVRYFRKPFRVGDDAAKATLTVSCDNECVIFLDSKAVGENSEWSAPTVIDLTKQLKAGDHVLAVRAANHGGPAGLLARLDVNFSTPKRQSVVTDTNWL